MPPLKVLVAGAGIAGQVAAYWLHRAGHTVTVIERDPHLRSTGQSIDIRGAAVHVIRLMGLEEEISRLCTDEAGIAFVDSNDNVRAAFAASGDKERQSFTSEFEILRGDLALILHNATSGLAGVRYIFDETITSIEPGDGGGRARVRFASSPSNTEQYDLVVGADGLGSGTRSLAFQTTTREHIWSLDIWTAYFTANVETVKPDRYSRWFNAPGRRYILARPDKDPQKTRATLMVLVDGGDAERARYTEAFRRGAEGMRQVMSEAFRGVGWKAPELVAAMHDTDDLYGSEVAQIRMESIVMGRVALVGDAGYCPTPLTGMGTSLAIIGAYVLAGEISLHADNVEEGVRSYEGIMLPYSKQVQKIPKWLPKIANPATAWGISVQHFVLGWVAWLQLEKLGSTIANLLPGGQSRSFNLPEYDWNLLQER